MAHGFHGKILHVDLTNGQIEIEEPPESFYRFYMGGSALGMYYVLKHTPPHADPLGPENTLVLALSVLTGTPISGQSRMTAVAKSPSSEAIGDSQCGGFWPAELKFAGFDAVVLRGRAPKPVYLWIHDGQAELRDAAHLWGRITGEVQAAIHQELGDDKIEVLQCGPAGEKGVRFAALINMCNRANGRTGMGAVMASKNLKAVAVRGKARPIVADSKALNKLARWGADNLEGSGIAGLARLGTAETVMLQQLDGGLPTRNWSSGVFEGAEAISGEVMYDTILKERDTCYACTVRCKRVVEITEGPYQVDPLYGGPEYETLSTLGSYCGVSDLAAVSKGHQLCDQYGLDSISCGATIAWAMDCFEHGLLTPEDTGGIELRFGNAEAMVQMVELIGKREGFGDILAEGSARAAKKIGRGTEDLVVAVKNQEYPAHMPQVKRSLALIYAVNPFGADHQSSEHDPAYEPPGFDGFKERLAQLGLTEVQERYSLTDEKIRFALLTEIMYSALDTLNLCQFVYGPAWQLYGPDQMVETVQHVTGWDVTLEELMLVGERRLNMLRAFNAREGFGRDADTLPKKLTQPLKGGPSDGLSVTVEEFERAKDVYYAMCGWDVATGKPTRDKLTQLGLEWVADIIQA
jgi:aldehyde:ferredoxin oxidoreductase